MTARSEYVNYWRLGPWFRPYVWEILLRWGRDPTTCEQCGNSTKGRPNIHHTKYEFATIHDLQIVCQSCNLKGENRWLS